MPLEELNEKLNKRDYEPGAPHESLPYTPEGAPAVKKSEASAPLNEWTEDTFQAVKKESTFHKISAPLRNPRTKKIILSGVGLLVILGVGLYIFQLRGGIFTNEKILLSMAGPTDVESNLPVTYKITYENHNLVSIEKAELIVSYPSTFHPESGSNWKANTSRSTLSLGSVAAGTIGSVELRGTFSAFQNQVGTLQSILRFSPKGSSSQYDVSKELGVTIASSPVALEMTAPREVGDGQVVEYMVSYKNASGQALDNMRLVLQYPEGFHFTTGNPKPSEGTSVWNLGTISVGGTGTFKINGTLTGVKDEVKTLRAKLGKPQGDGSLLSFAESEKVTRIVASPLGITQTVNGQTGGSVNPGDTLQYSLNYRNDGNISLRAAIVTVDVDSEFLDLGQLSVENGVYDALHKQVLYKASEVPALQLLEPGAQGILRFSLPVRKDIGKLNVKNPAFETVAHIDSPDVPTPIGANKIVGSNVIRLVLASPVQVDWKGYYTDTVHPNTGPMPLQIGQETTYTLHARVQSEFNDITDSVFVITLPGNVQYKKNYTENATVSYNERTGELAWRIGTIPAGETNYQEFIFQVGLIPDQRVEEAANLVNNAILTGKDVFASRDIRIETKQKTTDLPEDPTVKSGGQ